MVISIAMLVYHQPISWGHHGWISVASQELLPRLSACDILGSGADRTGFLGLETQWWRSIVYWSRAEFLLLLTIFLEHFVLVALPVLLVRFVLNPDVLLAGHTFHVDLFVFFISPGFRCLDASLSRFTSCFCWLYHPNESRRYRYTYRMYWMYYSEYIYIYVY